MSFRAQSVIIFLSTIACLAAVASSQVVGTQCYVLDGAARGDFHRCNNETTGHTTCCDIGDTCYSNGICMGENNGVQDYQRKGCTDPTWRDPACLDVCVQFANFSTAGVRWCGNSLTSSTEYCCDTGAQGIGSFACCNNDSSLFAISPAPTVVATILSTAAVAYPPGSSSTSTSSSSTSSSVTSTTSSAAAATTTAAAPHKSSVNGAAIGAGVGVPVGVILALALGFFLWRRNKKAKARQAFELQGNHQRTAPPYADNTQGPYEAMNQYPTSSLQSPQTGAYCDGRKYDPAPQDRLQELPLTGPHVVHEMGIGDNPPR